MYSVFQFCIAKITVYIIYMPNAKSSNKNKLINKPKLETKINFITNCLYYIATSRLIVSYCEYFA